MFTLSPRWERFFHFMTFATQGSSFLNPRGYAILHRMHHAYSDTEGDPHSPVMHKNPFSMMDATRHIYRGIVYGRYPVEQRFLGDYPQWPALDRFAHRWFVAIGWGAAYTLFYAVFATAWWHFLLLPVHWMMGPIHGAIVNWFGHWLGYRNFDRDRRFAKHAALRLRHAGGAVPKQPPHLRRASKLRRALVRDRSGLARDQAVGQARRAAAARGRNRAKAAFRREMRRTSVADILASPADAE